MVCHLVGAIPLSELMLNQNLCISIQENAFENVVRHFAAIFSRPQCVNFYCKIGHSRSSVTQYWSSIVSNRQDWQAVVFHDDVSKWKHLPLYWPFVRGIHWSPVDSPHKCQWRWDLMFSLNCAWTKVWANNRNVGDFRHHRVHYDVNVMHMKKGFQLPMVFQYGMLISNARQIILQIISVRKWLILLLFFHRSRFALLLHPGKPHQRAKSPISFQLMHRKCRTIVSTCLCWWLPPLWLQSVREYDIWTINSIAIYTFV